MNLSKLKVLCFDEADYFFKEQSDTDDFIGFTTLVKEQSSNIQYLFFSATYSEDAMSAIKGIVQSHSIKIELPKERLALKGIKQTYIVAKKKAGDGPRSNPKLRVIKELIEKFDGCQVMIFLNTKTYLKHLFSFLTEEGFTVDKMMGGKDMDYAERDQVMRRFRKGEIKFLLCTDLLSRGIDVQGMNFIVNFDVPYSKNEEGFPVPEKETYLHRIGRTGRFDTKGVALTLINENDQENEIAILNEIKDYFQSEIVEIENPDGIKSLYESHVLAEAEIK